MHNLFAMEAVSIAEALGVPSLAVSACLVPQAAPPSLQRRFSRANPALHAALTRPGACLSIALASEIMHQAFTSTQFSVWPPSHMFVSARCRMRSTGLQRQPADGARVSLRRLLCALHQSRRVPGR